MIVIKPSETYPFLAYLYSIIELDITQIWSFLEIFVSVMIKAVIRWLMQDLFYRFRLPNILFIVDFLDGKERKKKRFLGYARL